jgi:hypothetical protein
MAFIVGGKIVKSNLVLYLDAGNSLSYRNDGLWRDLTSNKNDFTLNNNPQWDGEKVIFNTSGGNQGAQCVNTTFGNFGNGSFTLEFVYNYTTGSGIFTALVAKRISMGAPAAANRPGFSMNPENTILVTDSTGAINNPDAYITYSSTILKNTTVHQTLVVERDSIDTNIVTASLYLNNSKFTDNIKYRMSGSGDINNNLNCRLFYSYDGYYSTGSLYYVRAYDRALSSNEISQNYIVARDRFNL